MKISPLPLHYQVSMDWDEAVATLRHFRPDLSRHLDSLLLVLTQQEPTPPYLEPVEQLLFLVQTTPLTLSLH